MAREQDASVLQIDAEEGTPPDEVPGRPSFRARLAELVRGWHGAAVGGALLVGLILGWMVLGWLFFPVRWTNTDPWDLRSDYQKRYIALVASDFRCTGDLRSVRQALDGWDERALTKLLADMETKERNPETRQQYIALADALKLSRGQPSLVASLLSQKGILLSLFLAAVPMVAAIVLAVSSVVTGSDEKERLAEVAEDEAMVAVAEAEQFLAQQTSMAEAVQQQQQGNEAPTAEDEKKKAEAVLAGQSTSEEDAGQMGDLLNSLFDDDNEALERLESISKSLTEIDIDALLRQGRDVIFQFRGSRQRAA